MIITAIMLIRLITSILRTEIETDASWKKREIQNQVHQSGKPSSMVLVDWSWTPPGSVLMLTAPATDRCRLAEVTWTDEDLQWLVPLRVTHEWGEWKQQLTFKTGGGEEKENVLCKPQTSCWQISWGLQDVCCLTWLYFPSCLLDFVEILTNVASCNGLFYFFLPKKLNLFSRSLSFPSLLRMVTPPPSAELGEMGGMVMARLSARGPPGESPGTDGTEPRMERIQAPISAWGEEKKSLPEFPCSGLALQQTHL